MQQRPNFNVCQASPEFNEGLTRAGAIISRSALLYPTSPEHTHGQDRAPRRQALEQTTSEDA
jgi:hypothetical protein